MSKVTSLVINFSAVAAEYMLVVPSFDGYFYQIYSDFDQVLLGSGLFSLLWCILGKKHLSKSFISKTCLFNTPSNRFTPDDDKEIASVS